MTVKSIISIDVDDARFKSFVALYSKYEDALTKAPGKWAQINQQITQGGKLFDVLAAAILAQTETLAQLITQQKTVTYEVEKQSRAWQGVAKWAKGVAGDIEGATKFLLRWSPLVTGILGLGGLYGIDRLAGSAAAGRRSAAHLGLNYGQDTAFAAAFGRFIDPESFLSSVATAKTDVTQRKALLALGVNPDEGNTADTAVALLGRLKMKADQTQTNLLGTISGAIGLPLTGLDLQALKRTSAEEFIRQNQIFQDASKQLYLSPEKQRAASDFETQMIIAGQSIKNTFIDGLSPLLPNLIKVSEGFQKVVTAFLRAPELKDAIDNLSVGFGHLANFFKGKESIKDFVSPSIAGAAVGAAAGSVVGAPWLGAAVGAGVGKIIGSGKEAIGNAFGGAEYEAGAIGSVPAPTRAQQRAVMAPPPPSMTLGDSETFDTFGHRFRRITPHPSGGSESEMAAALRKHGEALLDNTRATRDNTGATKNSTPVARVGSSTDQIVNAAH